MESAELELLDTSGKLIRISWSEVKWVCFVREPIPGDGSGPGAGTRMDSVNPERLLRRSFTSRPRMAGIWVRMTLSDGDELEGIAANDRSLIEGSGLMLTPPDTRSNTQRVFVPRSSIRELTVLGVIAPSAPGRRKAALEPQLYEKELFEMEQNREPPA